jgi:hypothetical protein
MAAKLKVDELESVDGSTNLILNNSVTMASGKTLPAASLTGTIAVARIADGTITAAKLAADTATQAELDAVSTASLAKAGGTMTGEVVLDEITETEATSAATTYTVNLANGTIFDLTSGSTCTVTMPAFEAGKSFTVISTVPSAWASSPAIIWSGGAAPTTGSGRTIYSFVSDGARWYGMQAGTGFA